MTIFDEGENPSWRSMADELIGSFRFRRAP
jgi:hypothetical protein